MSHPRRSERSPSTRKIRIDPDYGWGRVDAVAALNFLEDFDVMHISASDGDTLQYDFTWAEIFNITSARASLRTFVYEVQLLDETPVGWWPVAPEDVTFAYTTAIIPGTVSVGEEGAVRGSTLPAISWDGPNPVEYGGATGFKLELPYPGKVLVAVHDVAGRRLRSIVDAPMSKGSHAVKWDGRDDRNFRVPTGVYFVRFRMDDNELRKKIVVVR